MIDSLHCLVAVVEQRSLSRAAADLKLSVSSVSRKLDALEAHLGARLLVRGTRQVVLTDAGERFLPRARAVLSELAEGMAAVQDVGPEPRGLLTVTAPAGFARLHAAPAIASLVARYPLLQVQLLVGDSVVDLTEQRVDVALRAGVAPSGELVATRLAPQHRVVSASPAYLARHGWPATPLDLLQHQCLSMVGKSPRAWWRFEGVNHNQPLPVKAAFSCDDTDTLMHAALAGAGIIHLANWMVSDAIVAGKLVPVFPMAPLVPASGRAPLRHDPDESAIHAVHMPGRSNHAKAQLLINHLREFFGDPPYWDVAMVKAGAGAGAARAVAARAP
ncbi:LysR family transcriptional regulator [Duganella sp. Leaf126]|uniref:LysR family transcriptional regulator n=1 Tax=Duganella sp. Leaf126 TaxID=1736266 RepID=UPI000A66BB2C|nr:LysR family transcriptional regulator [Duganella sp. Leaf126]